MIDNSRQPCLWHIVLISFRETASKAVRRDVYNRYQTLDTDCGGTDAGLLFWKVGWNLDRRKNVHLVEVSAFVDDAALQAFRAHPKHKELTDILREVADWQVGDLILAHTVSAI